MRLPGGLGQRGGIGRKAGLGGIGLVIVVVASMLFGVDPSVLLQNVPSGAGPQPVPSDGASRAPKRETAAERQLAEFTSVVLADTEDTWTPLFESANRTYQKPKLVLFSDAVQSACGFAQAASGPFYCPGDRKVYIDLSFYSDLKNRFRAPGDFAQAYVVAHEIGHHVQTLLGISEQVMKLRRRVSKNEGNALSVMQELQADCFAGIWAHHAHRARNILEEGDIEEGLNAASAIGDDRLQRQSQGYVVPESFTHGSSEQRVRWFRIGLKSGTMDACNTFETDRL